MSKIVFDNVSWQFGIICRIQVATLGNLIRLEYEYEIEYKYGFSNLQRILKIPTLDISTATD